MNAIRGGLVGQTFALAKFSDTEGKKARVRRSKEERKAMVESFIKRYQKLNNGNFPSLNLAHKEVGGSFYIVREIVREIIQENRVLGPAKLSREEQNDYSFSEQYPLGSISTEPQNHVVSSEETSVTTNLHQNTTGEHVKDSHGKFYEPQYQRIKVDHVHSIPVAVGKVEESDESPIDLSVAFDKGSTSEEYFSSSSEQFSEPACEQFVGKETMTDYEAMLQEERSDKSVPADALPIHQYETSIEQLQSCSKELPGTGVSISNSNDIANTNSQQSLRNEESREEIPESLGNKKDGVAKEQEVLEAGITQMATDVVVETFPLRRVSEIIRDLDESSGDTTNSLEEKKTEDDRLNSPENGSVSRNEKGQATQEVLEVEKNKIMMDDNAVFDKPLKGANESTMTKSLIPENSGITDLDNTSSPAVTKPMIAPNGIHSGNPNTTGTVDSLKQPTPVNSNLNQNRVSVQHDSNSKKGSSSTLNRINLETWEARSKKSAGTETNPLLSLVKAFIAAFVKFWTA